jgi:autonomous glycyl radical cofactor GrcA
MVTIERIASAIKANLPINTKAVATKYMIESGYADPNMGHAVLSIVMAKNGYAAQQIMDEANLTKIHYNEVSKFIQREIAKEGSRLNTYLTLIENHLKLNGIGEEI